MKKLFSTLFILTSSCTMSHAALAAYWNLDEASGNIADSSGNGLTGSKATAGVGAVYSEASVTQGTYGALTVSASTEAFFGTSIDFAVNTTNNRSNYNIGTPASITNLASSASGGTGSFTVMAWINLDNTTGTQRIFGTGPGNGWAFGTVGNTLRFTTFGRADNNSPTAANLVAGSWAHIAMTYNNNSAEFFLNGNSLGVDTNAGGFNDETVDNYRVGSGSGGNEQFTGNMDELKIYDTALTIDEIRIAAVVPEPSSAALLGLGGFLLILRRRK